MDWRGLLGDIANQTDREAVASAGASIWSYSDSRDIHTIGDLFIIRYRALCRCRRPVVYLTIGGGDYITSITLSVARKENSAACLKFAFPI